MKIVHYLNHTYKSNGHVAVAVDLACHQAAAGHDVTMISAPGDFDEHLARHGVAIEHVDYKEGALRPLTMAPELYARLRRIRPDVVNAHMVAAAVAARVVRLLLPFRIVTTVHNSFDRQARLMGVGDRVIVVSDAVGKEMAKAGISPRKIRTVRNGTIGGARRPLAPQRELPLQHPAIVTVAGLHPRKGVDHLIRAFAKAHAQRPDAHLYIVGEGPCADEYHALAASTGCADAIHFLGFMEDPREVLATAEMFVLASLRDPFPLVLCEAREMGNAIVASSVDGIPEALAHGKRGILVPPADPDALAAELVRLLCDEPLRQHYAAAAAADLAEITVETMSARTVDIYREAIGRRPLQRSSAAPKAPVPSRESAEVGAGGI